MGGRFGDSLYGRDAAVSHVWRQGRTLVGHQGFYLSFIKKCMQSVPGCIPKISGIPAYSDIDLEFCRQILSIGTHSI
jgi:hypothetical protein